MAVAQLCILKSNIMTNILIPTDFSPASVKLAEQALHAVNVNTVNIVFFHVFELPYSEFELLNPSRPKPYSHLNLESFRQSCKQLKEQYPRSIQKISYQVLEGDSRPLFRNFIESNEIDMIFCPDHFVFKPVHKRSVNPTTLFKKSGIPVIGEPAATEVIFERTRVLQPAMAMQPVNS
jgi:Universal stress protein family